MDLEFSYKSQTFYIVYIPDTKSFVMEFNIWHDSIYMFKVFPSATPTLGHGFETKVTELPRWLSWMRRPTGDQEVAGTTPARSATFFRGD